MRINTQTQCGLVYLSSCIIANFIILILLCACSNLHHNLGNFVFIVLYVRISNFLYIW